jgi:regulator of sigma E protease
MGGPVLFSKKIGETEFKISSLPFGGYLEIAGLAEVGQGDQKEAQATDTGSFQVKPYWQKFLIINGGILFNLLATFLVFIGLFCTGMPKTAFLGGDTTKPIISRVVDGSIAQQIKLQTDDEIWSINDISAPSITIVIKTLQAHAGKPITLQIKRVNQLLSFTPTLDKTGRLGIEFKPDYFPRYGLLEATKKSFEAIVNMSKSLLDFVMRLFTKKAVKELASPLMFISAFVTNAKQGAGLLLFLLAFFSINLAILNLIPLPITDGGQLVFITIESIIGRQIPEKIRYGIHVASWILIMGLTAYLLIRDSITLFWPKIKALIARL